MNSPYRNASSPPGRWTRVAKAGFFSAAIALTASSALVAGSAGAAECPADKRVPEGQG